MSSYGFKSSYSSLRPLTVTAARQWDDPPHLQMMNPPIDRSIEAVFNDWATDDCFVITHKIVKAQGKTRKVEIAQELTE